MTPYSDEVSLKNCVGDFCIKAPFVLMHNLYIYILKTNYCYLEKALDVFVPKPLLVLGKTSFKNLKCSLQLAKKE